MFERFRIKKDIKIEDISKLPDISELPEEGEEIFEGKKQSQKHDPVTRKQAVESSPAIHSKRKKQKKAFSIESGRLEETSEQIINPLATTEANQETQISTEQENPLHEAETGAAPMESEQPTPEEQDPISMATPELYGPSMTEGRHTLREKRGFRDSATIITFTREGVVSDYEELDKKKEDALAKKRRARILKPYLHKLTEEAQILDSEIPEHNVNFQKGRIKTLEGIEKDIKAGNLWKKNERKSYEKGWDNLREWARVKEIWGDSEQKEYKKEIENMRILIDTGEYVQQKRKEKGKMKIPQEKHLEFEQNQVNLLKRTKLQMEFDGKWDAEARRYYQSSWEKLRSFSKNKDVNIWTDEDEKEFKRETEEIRDPEKWKVGLGIITFALYGFAKAGTVLFQKTMEMVGKIDKDLDIYSDYKKSVKMRKDFFSGKLFKDLMGKQEKKREEKKPFEVDEREVNKKRKESEIAFWKKEKESLQQRGLWEGDANEKNRRDYEKVWRDIRIDWIANVAWDKEDEKEFREQVGYPLQQETDTYEGLAEKARLMEDILTSAERGELRSLQDRKRKREKDARGKPEDKDLKQEIKEIGDDIDDIKNKVITRWKNGEWPPYTQNEGKTKGKKGKGGGRRQEEALEREVEEKEDNQP